MGTRRSVTVEFTNPPESRLPEFRTWDAIRFEFGPWWHRWWLVVRHGGRRHHNWLGEPCVVFPAPEGGA